MINDIVLAASRHLLHPAPWARQRLAEHAGKQVSVDYLLGALLLRISEDGFLHAGDANIAAELKITLTPLAAAKWLTDRKAGWREARVEGDMDLAAAVSHVMANLRWDYEEDLSRVVGDIAAHRIGGGVRRLSAWPPELMESFSRGVAEFLSEERKVLLTPLRMAEFSTEVDDLRDATARLDKRLEKLERLVAETVLR